ncbi:MAG: non-heme iron oxygenase ferredoxin subunit [Mariprofundales bacterium]|nr:non-heme iron oxygenase ferredoxin subunit [Mariprofundales bacterium]
MATWIDTVTIGTVERGEHTVVATTVGDIALFNIDGEIVAIEDRCSHDDGHLACGRVEGDEIICPRHGARFSLRTGEALSPPAYEEIETFPVREHSGMLQINIDN